MIMLYQERITYNPKQCGGKPCIRGLRVRVKDILEMLAGGMTEAEILADFEYLGTKTGSTVENRITHLLSFVVLSF
jgi:uncharacterized protein (DUF433 family)